MENEEEHAKLLDVKQGAAQLSEQELFRAKPEEGQGGRREDDVALRDAVLISTHFRQKAGEDVGGDREDDVRLRDAFLVRGLLHWKDEEDLGGHREDDVGLRDAVLKQAKASTTVC